MDRRALIATTGAVGVAGLLAACGKKDEAPVAAAPAAPASPAVHTGGEIVRWRCSSGFPSSLDTLFGTAVNVAKRISDATDGRFQITVAPAGEIVPMPQAADAVSNGTVECSHTAPFYYVGQDPTWAFGTTVPFGMNARQFNAWWFEGGGEAAYNQFLAPRNMRYLVCGNTGVQMGGWYRSEVKTLEEVRGLRIRIAGLGGRVWAALGAVPQQIAGGDIMPALERGTLDAVEWVGPHDDERLGFNRVARFYYYPAFWEPGAAVGFLVNNRAWDALPPAYREIFKAAAHEGNASMMAKYDHLNPIALRRLVAGGTELRPFPRPILEAAFRASQEMYAEINAQNAEFKRVHDHYFAAMRPMVNWMRLTEATYDSFIAAQLRG